MPAATDALPTAANPRHAPRAEDAFTRPSLAWRREVGALDETLATARAGGHAALVLSGEAGIGKTTLLAHLVEQATDCRTLRAAGVESEAGMPYAGLHQVLLPLADRIGPLPPEHRAALAIALGVESGPVPDPLLVGRATSMLLGAGDRPVVCTLDDAHLLDRESLSAIAVVARTMPNGRGLALVCAARDGLTGTVLAAVPEVRISPLTDREARALLAEVIVTPVDGMVRDRIVAEARGNPRLLLDLPGAISAADAAAGFTAVPRPAAVAEAFARRLGALSGAARRALVVAAAEPVGDVDVFWRALQRLRIDRDAVGAMERAGLVDIGPRVRFRHPALRTAAYHSASVCERKDAHAALASATNARDDPDWRAWHRALAAYGPDEQVAAELEAASARAMERGGNGAAAALLDRAATLTPEPERRAVRLLAAANAKREAGALGAAVRLVAAAEAIVGDAPRSAEILQVRGQIERDKQRPAEAVRLLGDAAAGLEVVDVRRARAAYLEALVASLGAGAPYRIATAALAVPGACPVRPTDHLLEALARRMVDGRLLAATRMQRSLAQAVSEPLTEVEAEAAGAVAVEVWDADALQQLALARAHRARSVGAVLHLEGSLGALAFVRLLDGGAHEVDRLLAEGRSCAATCGLNRRSPITVVAAAFRGDEAATAKGVTRLFGAAARGDDRLRALASYTQAVLANGLGRYAAALDASRDLLDAETIGWWPFAVSEAAEAASRVGDDALLREVLGRVTAATESTPTEWSLGIADRVGALTRRGGVADRLHRRSIDRLERTPLRVEVARGRLLYGEWLRREGRRVDARAQLSAAHSTFEGLGFDGFARRAWRELQATGETVRQRLDGTRLALTPQEAEIARLAAAGATNVEIGLQLFISARTVEWHLRKIFAKLGVTTRRQLRHHHDLRRAVPSTN